MAIITDPDTLIDPTNIAVDPATKTIELIVAGGLGTDGVTIKCVYSKLKELWKSSSTYVKYPFPMGPITDEQFEMIDGWDWKDDSTRYLLRTGGWSVISAGVSVEEWAGIITLGEIGGSSVAGAGTDQVYFQQSSGAGVDFERTGAVNQAVKIYGDASHGSINYRSSLTLFSRTQGKLFSSANLTTIGVSAMTYQAYRFPLSNASDLKITHTDVQIDSTSDGTPDVAPYDGMSITWYATAESRSIGGTPYDFHVIIDANQGTLEQVYEYVQWALRRTTGDIDAGSGTKVGNITNALLHFVGDTLYCDSDASGGVYIDDIQEVDSNRIWFKDDTGTLYENPYTAVITLNFSPTLAADDDAVYRVFFTNDDAGDNLGNDFGTANAVLVDDSVGADMSGTISNNSSIQKSYNYGTNVQRGAASANTPVPITVVCVGLNTAQYVLATGTIIRSKTNTVTLSAPLERNYQNA